MVVVLAAQGAVVAQSSHGISAAEAAIVGALIAGLASFTTVALNFFVQRWLTRRTERTEATRVRVDQITQQLNRLYGPLLLLTVQNKALADKLREGKQNPDQWHLLDNLAAVAADPADRAIADQINEVNARIEGLILARAGLIQDGDVPESFISYLGHYRFLRIAFDAAKAGQGVPRGITAKRFEYFPATFDDDVKNTYTQLSDERKQIANRE